MENFIVSARKYRPQNFEEVVGQQHVTRTLLNAIKQNHLAQALLFTGPRGVGKTTCARILARMINTEDGADAEQDFAFNIFELDAASNNSVDDIRNLIDQVRFAPQAGNYKVYIIDEVHMLSQAAFNAFLKTLEEPPKHAIFILATTEKHKIIPTILSRCQIFDFKRITVEDIAGHLQSVAQQEGVQAEPEALHIIAQKSDGALRDALSIFDRIVSFSGQNISYKDVIDNLRILDYDYYFRTVDLIQNGDSAGLLLLFNDILDNGFDGHLYLNGLAGHFRDLLVCKDPKTLELLEVAETTRQRYRDQAQNVDTTFALKALKLLNECDVRYKGSNNPRLLVELSLLQMAHAENGVSEKKKSDHQTVKKTPEPAPAPTPTPAVETKKADASHAAEVLQRELGKKQETQAEKEKYPEEAVANAPAAEKEPSYSRLKSRTKRSSFSISDTIEDNLAKKEENESEEDETAVQPGLPKEDFNETQLKNLWNEYMEMLRGMQKQKVYGSLNNKTLRLKENFTVELELESEIQQSFFEEEKRDIIMFLREKLNNFSLQFTVKIAKSAKNLEPYSAEEKFQYMVAKNPNLLLLKQKLDLDVE
ncbi:MAG TPA: DNA polymerase III subunit gamma/tau [Cryomorphaceae bacterium]|nr:DNA polymerase III subunit gamma/tau [Owenweeksia sp.]HCQ14739.1 DNA polymerase III subunit gamma/tau [Cryomorphaceae bacterium]|tara:strand:- start:9974 stop:11752 length:1779 start_codon:yes stop_codon:yes gene_type:complete